MTSCNSGNNANTKKLKFVDNILSIVKGASVIGGISFNDFSEEVTEYVHSEMELVGESSSVVFDVPKEYRTIAIKVTYPDKTPLDNCVCLYHLNAYMSNDRPVLYDAIEDGNNVEDEFHTMSQFIIINSPTSFPIKSLTVRNPNNFDIHLNFLFTK